MDADTTPAATSSLELVLRLGRARARIAREVEHAASGHGLALGDLALLRELAASDGGRMRRSDLATRMGVTTSAIARQLGPLERIGVVARESNPRDARLALVVLTDAGARVEREASVIADERADAVLQRTWSARERDELAALLDRADEAR